jgi:hypothetical protein
VEGKLGWHIALWKHRMHAPDYWKPKAMVAANAKAKPAKNGMVNAADTSKMDDKDKHESRKVALVQFGNISAVIWSGANARGIPTS